MQFSLPSIVGNAAFEKVYKLHRTLLGKPKIPCTNNRLFSDTGNWFFAAGLTGYIRAKNGYGSMRSDHLLKPSGSLLQLNAIK
jgi:hypothetical protein